RPWLVMIGASVVLAGLAIPLTHLQLRNTAAETLPTQSEQREFLQLMTEQYPKVAQPETTDVADTSIEEAESWAASLESLDNVAAVHPPQALGTYVGVMLQVSPQTPDAAGAERDIVEELRADRPDFDTWVTGTAAQELDFSQPLRDGAPA